MSVGVWEVGVPAAAPAATLAVVVLSCAATTVLDLAGTVLAKEWALRRAPGLLAIGLAVHAVLFAVYAISMRRVPLRRRSRPSSRVANKLSATREVLTGGHRAGSGSAARRPISIRSGAKNAANSA